MEDKLTKNQDLTAESSTLFELSWEVCNKVGGIYSVISSKVSRMQEYYKDYTLIGPYFHRKAEEDFSEEEIPDKFKETFDELRQEGIVPHYGSWLIKGEPKTILVEFEGITYLKDEIKKEIWEKFGVESLYSGWEFEEPLLFSWAVGKMLLKMEQKKLMNPKKTVLHAHEWMTGFSILELKARQSKISTVFTTHATMLGRSISSNSQDLFTSLGNFDPYQKAKEVGVVDKFTAERACAQKADIFTTVSEMTGRESEYILGRKPEVLVLNGLDMDNFPSIEETSIKHVTSREIIREFLAYTFFPYYKFDLSRNLSFFLAGRYEFQNKGIDIFIEALGKLNEYLKKENSNRTISAFVFMAMPNNGVKVELLENKNYYKHIHNYVHKQSHDLLKKIVLDFLCQENPSETLFNKEFLQEMKRDVLRFKRHGTPPLCTHKFHENEEQNSIISAFRGAGLNNNEYDKVKAILFPAYLDGNDFLLNMEFYDAIAGCHLGIFPSYYEPWGYTPLESGAVGVPAVTTDLAGFGRFIMEKSKHYDDDYQGIYVLNREGRTKEESVNSLFEILKKFSLMEHRERVENKIRAQELAHLADWKHFVKNYVQAHNLALARDKQT